MIKRYESGGSVDLKDPLILIPEGKYICEYLHYDTHRGSSMAKPKIRLAFMVLRPEAHFGIPLYRYYNLETAKPPFGLGGDFTLSGKGTLYREYCRFFGAPKRSDRLALRKNFRRFHWTCGVRTVIHDFHDNEIPVDARYSVIDTLLPYRASGEEPED